MLKYMRHHGEKGQIVILLAFAMIGLLGIVGLALDGGMLYWNQRRAQNGADAAVIAGVTAMTEHTLLEAGCGPYSEQGILDLIKEYAGVNEVPNADAGENIVAYYLIEEDDGDRVDLLIPGTGDSWWVGLTEQIPCDYDPIGLRVEASFPQQTFLAGVIGIANTNVTVEASAIVDNRKACADYVLLTLGKDCGQGGMKIAGANTTVAGAGIHSNCGMQLAGGGGGGGEGISLASDKPIEYAEGAATNINTDKIRCNVLDEKQNPVTSDCEPGDPDIGPADSVGLGDIFYSWESFTEGGTVYNQAYARDPSKIYTFAGDLGKNDVVNPDGSWKHGLYIVEGEVKLQSLESGPTNPWLVTIAAKGKISISGGFFARAWAGGVMFYTESNNQSDGAISLSGNENSWSGLIAAPNGLVSFAGAHNSDVNGMVVGYTVDATGSDNQFKHNPGLCPYDPPSVVLIQ